VTNQVSADVWLPGSWAKPDMCQAAVQDEMMHTSLASWLPGFLVMGTAGTR
jgi:hypothetical protein